MIGLLALLGVGSVDPAIFGLENLTHWECKAAIDRPDTLLTGNLVVSSEGAQIEKIEWQSRVPIEVDDYRTKSAITQSGWWFRPKNDEAPEDNTILLKWVAPAKPTKLLLVNYGGDPQTGGFVSLLRRTSDHEAMGTIKLKDMLRWAGNDEFVHFSLGETKDLMFAKKHAGHGRIPVSVYRQLLIDYRQLRADLAAKVADFQAQCTKGKFEIDPTIVISAGRPSR